MVGVFDGVFVCVVLYVEYGVGIWVVGGVVWWYVVVVGVVVWVVVGGVLGVVFYCY